MQFIEKHQIDSVIKYQQKLKEFPKEVSSLWFIQEIFGSWDKLLIQLGESRLESYCWSKIPNDYHYQDLDEIEKELGSAIFNRFDKIIKFNDLSNEAKSEIGKKWFLELSSQYEQQYGKKLPQDIKDRLESYYSECENARQVRHLMEDIFSHYLVSGIE